MNIIYYTFINNGINPDFIVQNQNRQNYINEICDFNRKRQSFVVWKLLEYAVKLNFGVNFDYVNNNGVWETTNGDFYFSLSHSKNMASVCISKDARVGLDCELVSDKALKLEKYFGLAKINFNSIYEKKKYLTKLWCKKESQIKSNLNLNGNYRFVKDGKDEYCIYSLPNDKVKIIKVDCIKLLKEKL